MTLIKTAVAVFYKKRLNKSGLRWHIEQASMTCYSFAVADSISLENVQTDYPPVSVVSSEWLGQDVESLIHTIRKHSSKTYIIYCYVHTTLPSEEILAPLLHAVDPDAFCTLSELTACLQAWQLDQPFLSAHLRPDPKVLPADTLPGWHTLTAAERRVLHELADGQSGTGIADAFFISKRTVNNHKTNISRKLTVSGGPGSLIRFVSINRNKILRLLDE